MKSFFSSHGLDSLSQRFGISCHDEILRLLDERRYVPLRQEEGSIKIHKVIWIPSVSKYCNVVQDESNGEIVTVLHATLNPAKGGVSMRKIGHCVLGRAKIMAISSKPVFDPNTLPSIRVSAPYAMLRLRIGVANPETGCVREVKQKVSLQIIENFDNLLEDAEIQKIIMKILYESFPGFIIEFILVKIGNSFTSGPLHWFPPATPAT